MKRLLALAAAGEAAFGLVLAVYPPIVVRLLFNAEIAGAGVVISRIAGLRALTARFGNCDRLPIRVSVIPSERYSTSVRKGTPS